MTQVQVLAERQKIYNIFDQLGNEFKDDLVLYEAGTLNPETLESSWTHYKDVHTQLVEVQAYVVGQHYPDETEEAHIEFSQAVHNWHRNSKMEYAKVTERYGRRRRKKECRMENAKFHQMINDLADEIELSRETAEVSTEDSAKTKTAEIRELIKVLGKMNLDISSLESEHELDEELRERRDEVFNEQKTRAKDAERRVNEVLFEREKDEKLRTLERQERAAAAGADRGTGQRSTSSNVKREAIKLPSFMEKDEKTAVSEYPIWIQSWERCIRNYPEDEKFVILYEKLGSEQKSQIASCGADYAKAMERLMEYYGNASKAIDVILTEVMEFPQIKKGDFKNYVIYCDLLMKSEEKLRNLDRGTELNNVSAMKKVLHKWCTDVREQWYDSEPDNEESFCLFVRWLGKRRNAWFKSSQIQNLDKPAKTSKAFGAGVDTSGNQVAENEDSAKSNVKCFKCDKIGHIQRFCRDKTKGGGLRGGDPQKKCSHCQKVGHVREKCFLLKKKDKNKASGGNNQAQGGKKGGASNQAGGFNVKKYNCANCTVFDSSHSTGECKIIKNIDDPKFRSILVKRNQDCVRCLGDHEFKDCKQPKADCGCGASHDLHAAACEKATVVCLMGSCSGQTDGKSEALLHFMRVQSIEKNKIEGVFFDTGATSCFVTDSRAEELNFKYRLVNLSLRTLGGKTELKNLKQFICKLKDVNGRIQSFDAFGIETVLGAISGIDPSIVEEIFPSLRTAPANRTQDACRPEKVDFLIGNNYPSWQPMRGQRAEGGGDCWLMHNVFGSCVGGVHPRLTEYSERSMVSYIKVEVSEVGVVEISPTKNTSGRASTKNELVQVLNQFEASENLMLKVEPKCGACKCQKCPVPGSLYTFQGQKELDIIKKNLKYNHEEGRWYSSLPWKYEDARQRLPRTDSLATKTMLSVEKGLAKKMEWAQIYCDQMDELVKRGVVREVSLEEFNKWEGPYYFLPHLAVIQPDKTTKVRICWDASRLQAGGPSMNSLLYKGPDNMVNDLAAVLLSFRYGREASVCDVQKMHNKVRLEVEDTFMQLFKWRGLAMNEPEKIYSILVNTFGVSPANAIATVALRESADLVLDEVKNKDLSLESGKTVEIAMEDMERAVEIVKDQSYIDDILTGFMSEEEGSRVRKCIDRILQHADMKSKGWISSGDMAQDIELNTDEALIEKALGCRWQVKEDKIIYKVNMKFSGKSSKNSSKDPVVTVVDLLENPIEHLTRRIVLSEVAKIFDPLGLVGPVILEAKLLIRLSWDGDKSSIPGWDDRLEEGQVVRWNKWFVEVHMLEDISFDRSVVPKEKTIGLPILVTFSDGSDVAYGAVCYLRWSLESGSFSSHLLCARSRVSKKGMTSVPRLELQGALTGNRLKHFVKKGTKIKIEKAIHLVDSRTIVHYVSGERTTLPVYEGIRICEIQSTNTQLDDGGLAGWGWVPREHNPADFTTRAMKAKDLATDFWQKGPEWLQRAEEDWPVDWQVHLSKPKADTEVNVIVVKSDVLEIFRNLIKKSL